MIHENFQKNSFNIEQKYSVLQQLKIKVKRKLKIKEVSFWDYLINIIIPISLLACGIIIENKGNIMVALGIGYTIVILSYNRINILKLTYQFYLSAYY